MSVVIRVDTQEIPKTRRILIFVKNNGGWHTADWDESIQEFFTGSKSCVAGNHFHLNNILAWAELPEELVMFHLQQP